MQRSPLIPSTAALIATPLLRNGALPDASPIAATATTSGSASSPLLPPTKPRRVGDGEEDLTLSRLGGDFHEETKAWMALALPIGTTLLCRTGAMLTDLSVLGWWDSSYLSAAGVATVFISISSVIVWRGMLDALNTLCGQAFGSGNFKLAGEWLRISFVLSFTACVPLAVAWSFAGTMLEGIGKFDDLERDRVNEFCRVFIVGLLPFTAYVGIQNYIQTINPPIVRPLLYINLVSLVVNLLLNLELVHGVFGTGGWGFRGSALSTSLTRWFVLLLLMGYIASRVRREPEGPLALSFPRRWLALVPRERLAEFAAMAGPLAISSFLEEAQIQIVGVFAMELGKDELAAHNGMLQIFLVLSSFSMATSAATQIRVSRYLGAGSVSGAKTAMRVGLAFSTGLGFLICIIFTAMRERLAYVFTEDEAIRHQVGKISMLAGMGFFSLSGVYITLATLDAQGRVGFLAIAYFIGAWMVGVPSAYVLAFKVEATRGVFGLWLGLLLGYSVISILSAWGVARSDWPALVEDAKQRSARRPSLGGEVDSITEAERQHERVGLLLARESQPE